MTNPEYKEKTEKYRENQMLTPDLIEKIKDRVAKNESYPDNVYCPNQSCGVPVKITVEDEMILLTCSMCGFERKIDK